MSFDDFIDRWQCPYCQGIFVEVNRATTVNHTRWCSKNPEREKSFKSHSEMGKSSTKEYYDWILGPYRDYQVPCHKCGKEFIVIERESRFPEKEKYFCSRSCANSRPHSEETKRKIRDSVSSGKSKNIEVKKCIICGEEFTGRNKTCGKEDCAKHNNRFLHKDLDMCRRGGLASSNKQRELRRSKNEIHFARLCEERFENVLTNESIFNGWDADVILPDYKIAVLWNGNWHHKKITANHSVEQVKTRDKIKIDNILLKGYIPYIVDDYHGEDEDFVLNEFKKFIRYIEMNLEA